MEIESTHWDVQLKQAIQDANFSSFDRLLDERGQWLDGLSDKQKMIVIPLLLNSDKEIGVLVEQKMDELKQLLVQQNNQKKALTKYDKY